MGMLYYGRVGGLLHLIYGIKKGGLMEGVIFRKGRRSGEKVSEGLLLLSEPFLRFRNKPPHSPILSSRIHFLQLFCTSGINHPHLPILLSSPSAPMSPISFTSTTMTSLELRLTIIGRGLQIIQYPFF